MGNRDAFPGQSGGSIGRWYVEFKIKLNGASAPTILSGSSFLATSGALAHVGGTNVISVTLRDPWPEIIFANADLRDDAPNGAYVTIGSITGENSQTVPPAPIAFKLNTWTAGGAVSNDSSATVSVSLAIRNSNTTYGNNP